MGGPAKLEHDVGAPRLEPRQVHRNVGIAELTETPHDRLVTPVFPQPRNFVEWDLETRQAVVVADAELPEAERANELLGCVDPAPLLGSDGIAVLEAGGETGERRLVPRRQPELA